MMKVKTSKGTSQIKLTNMGYILMKCKHMNYTHRWSATRIIVKVNKI
jgi:hypothetical protein